MIGDLAVLARIGQRVRCWRRDRHIEQGSKPMNRSTLARVAAALGLTLDQLLAG